MWCPWQYIAEAMLIGQIGGVNILEHRCLPLARRVGMSAMYVYLGVAITLVIVRVIEIAMGH